jgi:hypothetical protein
VPDWHVDAGGADARRPVSLAPWFAGAAAAAAVATVAFIVTAVVAVGLDAHAGTAGRAL